MKKSFYDWCIENARQDLLDRWDYELNPKAPNNVGCTSVDYWYFKCPVGQHESTPYKLTNVTRHVNSSVKCIKCNSFALWGIFNIGEDFLEKYWDYNKNKGIDPWELSYGSREEIYIFCQEKSYHESYKTKPSHFIAGFRCPYCSGAYIHKLDSFGQWAIDNICNDFLEKYWDYDKNKIDPMTLAKQSKTKIYIKCLNKEYHGSYTTYPGDFIYDNNRCPFCSCRSLHRFDSLGAVRSEALDTWSDLNEDTPFDIAPKSKQIRWFKCENNKHKDYKSRVYRANIRNFECPKCHSEQEDSYLQKMVDYYIEHTYDYEYLKEYDCTLECVNPMTGYVLPYDRELIIGDKHLIIEVQGYQHYNICLITRKSALERGVSVEKEFELQQYRDEIKKDYVLENGYEFLEIPYTCEGNESYKTLIDNKILSLTTQN